MSSWGLIYWNGINAAQNQIQRLFDCKMLYLLQLVSTHQGPFSSIAVIMTKNYNDLNKDKIPKRNCFQVACSILISHSLPQVSLIPSIFTFCIKCLLYLISFWHPPKLHHDHHCLPSHHSFSPQGSKMIPRVLDRVIWVKFKVVQPVQTCRESFFFDLEFGCPAGVRHFQMVSMLHKTKSKTFLTARCFICRN